MDKRLHKVQGKVVLKRYRILPYDEIVSALRKDGAIFFEDSKEQRLRRGTIWKATKKLTEMLGKPVVAQKGLLQTNQGLALEGYLFSVEGKGSLKLKGKPS